MTSLHHLSSVNFAADRCHRHVGRPSSCSRPRPRRPATLGAAMPCRRAASRRQSSRPRCRPPGRGVVAVLVDQLSQVPGAVADVDLRVVEIGDPERRAAGPTRDRLPGHRLDLHQPHRADLRRARGRNGSPRRSPRRRGPSRGGISAAWRADDVAVVERVFDPVDESGPLDGVVPSTTAAGGADRDDRGTSRSRRGVPHARARSSTRRRTPPARRASRRSRRRSRRGATFSSSGIRPGGALGPLPPRARGSPRAR